MTPLTYGGIAALLGVVSDKMVAICGNTWSATIVAAIITLAYVWIGATKVVRP